MYFFINNFNILYYSLSSKLLNILRVIPVCFLKQISPVLISGILGMFFPCVYFSRVLWTLFIHGQQRAGAACRAGSKVEQVLSGDGEAGAGGGLCSHVNNVRKDSVRPGMQRKEQTGEFLTYILLLFFSSSPTSAWLLFESVLLPRFFEEHSVPPTMCPYQRMFAFLLFVSAWGVCDWLCAGQRAAVNMTDCFLLTYSPLFYLIIITFGGLFSIPPPCLWNGTLNQ